MADHVHMLLSIPPKYSVAQVVRFYQGESGDPHCSDLYGAPQEPYRAPFGSGVPMFHRGHEAVIREYIRTHEAEDRRLDQMDLW